MFVDHVQN